MNVKKVLVIEPDLLWSSRISQTLKASDIPFQLASKVPDSAEGIAVAIVPLSCKLLSPEACIPALLHLGIPVIAHAGHRDAELLQLGRDLNATQVVTNGSLARSLPTILRQFLQESL